MADFQEGDTRRGLGDRTGRIARSDEDEETSGDEGEAGASGDEGEAGAGENSGSGHGEARNERHEREREQERGRGHERERERGHEGEGEHGHEGDDGHEHQHGHDHHAHDIDTLGVAVLTVSSSRTLDSDPSGDAIAGALREAGHEVVTRELVPDAFDRVQDVVNAVVGRRDVDAVVTTGGTGVTPDDVTVEAVEPLCEKRLPGFGELFRRRSEEQIGTRVVATRALAGIADGVPVFCLPGSEAAVELGVSEIILPEAGHLAGLATRGREEKG